MADWTGEQQDIFRADGNVLVSASAGSGKTTVMVKKVVDKICGDVAVAKILVLSYTNASAADMRLKIVNKLFEEIKSGAKTAEEVDKLRIQLDSLPFSDIGTMDSFCGKLIKENFEVLGISPAFVQMDETEEKEMKNRVAANVFATLYAEENPQFLKLVSKMSNIVDDAPFSNVIVRLYDAAVINPSPKAFFDRLKNSADDGENGLFARIIANYYQAQAEELLSVAERCLAECDLSGAPTYLAKLSAYRDYLNNLTTAKCPSDVRASAKAYSKGFRLTKSKILDDDRTILKALFDRTDDIFGGINEKLNADYTGYNVKDVGTFLKVTTEIVERFGKCYAEYKRLKNKVDFNDLSRFAIKLLENDERAKSVAEKYSCIFVDEYQDINPLQESIIMRLSRDNVFMVGDGKQSIYAFRNADNGILLGKKKMYEQRPDLGRALPMTVNFRSTRNILEFSDRVFSALMTENRGGVDYNAESRFLSDRLPEKPAEGADVEVKIFYPPEGETGGNTIKGVYSVMQHPYVKTQNLSYREGLEIAREIKGLLGRKFTEDKQIREITYSDIAVLFRKRSVGASYVLKALKDEGIPYISDGFVSDAGRPYIKQLTAALRVLDNSLDDVSAAGFLLSYFGGFDEKALAEVVSANRTDTLIGSIEKGAENGEYKQLCICALEFIEKWRNESAYIGVSELLRRIVFDSGFDAYVLSRPSGVSELQAVTEFICGISKTDAGKSIQSYLAYSANAEDKGEKLPPAEFGNAVRISTVHNSKGLEFPAVILARVGDGFGGARIDGDVVFDKDLGMGVKLYNEGERKKIRSVAYDAIVISKKQKEADENVRLLYVALTRAKNFLTILGSVKKADEINNALLLPTLPVKADSFLDLLLYAASQDSVLRLAVGSPREFPDCSEREEVAPVAVFNAPSEPYYSEIERVVNYSYPYDAATRVGLKYTVSAINRDAEEDSIYIPTVVSEDDVNRKTGIAYHTVMESIDFSISSKSGVDEYISSLCKKGVLSEEECALVDGGKIFNCISSAVIADGIKGSYLRERPFMLKCRANEVFETSAEDEILIQGTADLILLGKENVVIDFKYSSLPDDALAEKYQKQLNLYKTAVERAFGAKIHKKLLYSFVSGHFIEVK